MRALLDLLRGPAAGLTTKGVYWRGLLVTAIDGTVMCCPDTMANLQVRHRGGGFHGRASFTIALNAARDQLIHPRVSSKPPSSTSSASSANASSTT
ncbi:hypothetical protein [Rhodococcus sp. T2V]|uniref:hypothetical protein n=1 Tax=Rhodococcus sp. T2V TaxID=3034164 RepID=UPI0023E1EBBB|nr:hypothetical protein [Rhodococcus sp. T2V]